MNGISHQQAIQFIHQRLDGLLQGNQKSLLDEHLRTCEPCRNHSNEMELLPTRLQHEFHARWDQNEGPSKNMMAQIEKQNRRVIMSNRINFGFKAVASVVAVILAGLVINIVVSQMRDQAVTLTETSNGGVPVSALPDGRLLAFTSTQDGNHEIYTIHADGTEMTNLTNNPAYDANPYWSPDGKWIAFASDRTGFTQIYVMEADGSNVIQLTENNADHTLPLTMDFKADPWSPDGNTLLVLEQEPGEDLWTLKSIALDGARETHLVTGRISHSGISWSPDGNHVGLIQNDPQSDDANSFIPKLYVIRSDGSNPQEITDVFQPDERLFAPLYSWSTDGQSISLASYQQDIDKTVIYEVRLDDHSVTEKYSTSSILNNWQDAMTIAVMAESNLLSNWVRSDGTSRALNPSEHCKPWDPGWSGSYINRSALGSWAILGYCSNGDHWLYWENADGTTIKQLIDSPLSAKGVSFIIFAWSPDDRHVAFNFASPDKTVMYILDVDAALKDPSVQPEQVVLANSEFYTAPSWQPISNREVVEEDPTPEPSETSSSDRLIAFTSSQDGNFDIYSMRVDGSELTNLTNHPAQDVSPVWSPNGRQIAFESDRNGFNQIFLMNADGSNIVQLMPDEGDQTADQETKPDQWIGEPYNLSLNLWSPDGKKLVFLEMDLGNENGTLYVIDANGENKKPLVEEAGRYSSPSWSPDGKHVAFLSLENSVYRIYSTDADGHNLTNVTKKLELNETLFPVRYSWSRDGQSISFVASNWNYLLGGPTDSPDHKWTAYEASLDGNTLITNASAGSQIGGYWEDSYFLSGSATVSSSPEFTWVRSDGTTTKINPIENCQSLNDSTGFSTYKQSSNGNVVIGAYCPNDDKWLFWANSEGTLKPLLKSPIQGISDTNAMHLWAPPDFIWSSDDNYIAFNVFSLGKTDMYIVNTADALNDPSIQPFHINIGNGFLYYSPSWQPVSNHEFVEEDPTPEPSETISSTGLLAFTSTQDGNSEIYIMSADGNELTNLTNNPAYDSSPFWSPDGSQIAFISDRDGSNEIYLMDADGSNVFQVTDGEFDHKLESLNPWSPDGGKLLFTEVVDNDQWLLYNIDADGQNKTPLVDVANVYDSPSWSPDGQHIAYIILEPVGDRNMARIHVVDARGNGDTNITSILPSDEDIHSWNYSWTREGNVSFIAARVSAENRNTKFAFYEATIDGATLVEIAKTSSPLEDYWDGTSFMTGFGGPLTWLRSDGSRSEFKPYEVCQKGFESGSHSFYSRRSINGYLLFGAGCPNGDLWLYWSNPNGTITKPLFETSIPTAEGGLNRIDWSPDGKDIAFTVSSSGITSLYVVNLEEAIKKVLVLPEPTLLGRDYIDYLVDWQP